MNQEIIADLNKILPVVERVHGEHHPELHEVAGLYKELLEAPNKEVFEKLREVTDNYTAPDDACVTYQRAYRDLKTLDEEYVCR